MGHDVVEAGGGGLRQRREVALPHLVGPRLAAPDVVPPVALEVDRLLADEVHRADDVVPVARLEEGGDAVLAAAT